jgi:hypothetical protein
MATADDSSRSRAPADRDPPIGPYHFEQILLPSINEDVHNLIARLKRVLRLAR